VNALGMLSLLRQTDGWGLLFLAPDSDRLALMVARFFGAPLWFSPPFSCGRQETIALAAVVGKGV